MGTMIPPSPREIREILERIENSKSSRKVSPVPKEQTTQVRLGDSKFSNYLALGVTIAFIFSGLLIFVIKLCTN
tara:strand:+ start:32 stop:253 length:222 start_codon:yes stop_codon:yes gene_type:complete